ncbi:MAG TPA: RsbRD N-terminal domain-containing protein, partial [Pyrinomonadaceae bacterium]|nr:RsbRD N-terminal domain-containing protein [Pyrinomonadaceae bacterium]
MSTEICLLLHKGLDTIVREWTEKVMSDERIQSDAQLTRAQLLDHIPQIIEELGLALANERSEATDLKKGRDHGRLRWRQDFDLKEVLRELMLLRTVLMEHIHHHVTA